MQQYSSLILPAAVIVAFYFLLIRPQQQQAKKQAEMLDTLRPGVEIMTVGGIFATVVSVADDRVRVAVADGSEFEIAKRGINAVVESDDDYETDEDADEDADADTDAADEPPMEDAETPAETDAGR
jgi:preprotein translocase subunit YajC